MSASVSENIFFKNCCPKFRRSLHLTSPFQQEFLTTKQKTARGQGPFLCQNRNPQNFGQFFELPVVLRFAKY